MRTLWLMLRQLSPAADMALQQVCAAVGQNPTNTLQQTAFSPAFLI